MKLSCEELYNNYKKGIALHEFFLSHSDILENYNAYREQYKDLFTYLMNDEFGDLYFFVIQQQTFPRHKKSIPEVQYNQGLEEVNLTQSEMEYLFTSPFKILENGDQVFQNKAERSLVIRSSRGQHLSIQGKQIIDAGVCKDSIYTHISHDRQNQSVEKYMKMPDGFYESVGEVSFDNINNVQTFLFISESEILYSDGKKVCLGILNHEKSEVNFVKTVLEKNIDVKNMTVNSNGDIFIVSSDYEFIVLRENPENNNYDEIVSKKLDYPQPFDGFDIEYLYPLNNNRLIMCSSNSGLVLIDYNDGKGEIVSESGPLITSDRKIEDAAIDDNGDVYIKHAKKIYKWKADLLKK